MIYILVILMLVVMSALVWCYTDDNWTVENFTTGLILSTVMIIGCNLIVAMITGDYTWGWI